MFLSARGSVLALINDGELKVIKATEERYQPIVSYRVAEDRSWTPPVLLSSGILVKEKETLTRWSLAGSGTDCSASR